MIDEGSCTNVVYVHFINKLRLPTVQHPRSYSLEWLKKGNEVEVTKQTLIAYCICNFKDELLCDVFTYGCMSYVAW